MAQAADAVVERTNAFRKTQGLEPASVEPALERAAREFARFMAKTGKYGHTADGRRPPQRATAQGYEYCIVSENIAYQYRSSGYDSATLAREMVEGWKESPEHRKNMLEPAVTQTGVGIAQGDDGRYFGVQMFGRPKSAARRAPTRHAARPRSGSGLLRNPNPSARARRTAPATRLRVAASKFGARRADFRLERAFTTELTTVERLQ